MATLDHVGTPLRGLGTRLQVPLGRAPERRVIVGLDFGTSASKCVVQLPHDNADLRQFLVLGHEGGQILFPSAIATLGDRLVVGIEADACRTEVARSFKMCLACQCGVAPSSCPRCLPDQPGHFRLGGFFWSAEQLSILYLAHLLARVRGALRQLLPHHQLKVILNSAAPLDQLDGNEALRGCFERVLHRANLLSRDGEPPAAIHGARQALLFAERAPVPPREQLLGSVFPETHAAMTALLLGPGQRPGLFATADIGAGTTDIAFFWFHRTDGLPEACYYAASSKPVGMDNVDHALRGILPAGPGSLRARREAMPLHQILQHRPCLEGTLNGVASHYRRTWGAAYHCHKVHRHWVDLKSGEARFTLCLVGGGAQFPPLADHLASMMPAKGFGMECVPCMHPQLPEGVVHLDLAGHTRPVPAQQERVLSLLLLAYGLAHEAIDIPLYQTGNEFVAVRPVVPPVPAGFGDENVWV